MLVLSRKAGEAIELREAEVVIRVIAVKKSKVQLGIEAPREISVKRSELAPRRPTDRQLKDERMMVELVRLQTELVALAELSGEHDRGEASRIAGEAIERLGGIKRSLRLGSTEVVQPIAEFVTVRSDVIERLRLEQGEHAQSTDCVRQSSAGYAVLSASALAGCGVA